MEASKIVAGAVIGAAIGLAVGILFSPAKGTVVRRRLKRKGEDFAQDVEDSLGEFYDDVSKTYKTVVDEAKKIATKA
ncbi:MAG: YtxH-like protein [Bacteroidetes bacterium HLUCCA01]|nr:MAG: YtxH-like protein [Bacteroidetes bacterium HLUCCA01]